MATAKRRRPTKKTARRQQKKKGGGGGGWRRSPITGVVALLVIAYCLYSLFIKDDSYLSKYRGDYVCDSCNVSMRINYIKGAAPHPCPECSVVALYSALKCGDCNEIKPNLPPFRDFSCTSCKHHDEVRLDPTQGPHACPECSKKTFFETYECISCDHVFGWDVTTNKTNFEDIDFEDEEMMMEEFFFDEMVATCPKCNKPEAYPLIQDPISTCQSCDSENLKQITPTAVVKWELGRKLTEREEREVQRWKDSQE